MADNYLHSDITSRIIKAFYNVYNTLGFGFLEKVYQNSLMIELANLQMECRSQVPIDVYYNNAQVGLYIADIIVNNSVIVEIKAAEGLCEQHEAQLVNYLRATDIEVGMLLNFGVKAQFKKKIFTSEFKKSTTDQRKS